MESVVSELQSALTEKVYVYSRLVLMCENDSYVETSYYVGTNSLVTGYS